MFEMKKNELEVFTGSGGGVRVCFSLVYDSSPKIEKFSFQVPENIWEFSRFQLNHEEGKLFYVHHQFVYSCQW